MRKIIAAFKVSADFKYQAAGGYADWAESWADDYELSGNIDACVLGGGMYPGYEGYWSAMMAQPTAPSPMTGKFPTSGEIEWSKSIPSIPHIVLTHSQLRPSWSNTRVLGSANGLAKLKSQPGKAIYFMGGGTVFGKLLALGLVDEVRLIVHPVIAGGSFNLFPVDEVRGSAAIIQAKQLTDGKVRLDYALGTRTSN